MTSFYKGLVLSAFLLISHELIAQRTIKGIIIDKLSREPIEYAFVSTGQKGNAISSDEQGRFEIILPADSSILHISILGYAAQNIVIDKNRQNIVIELQERPVDLSAVTVTNQPGGSSLHTLSKIDLNIRPINSAQDLLRLVPGLFLGQHQGGGIAEHLFLRGFDADHGTDVNVSLDGMPINLVSHAHGQGFSDLHFLIPELVRAFEFGKGPYYTDHGDFTTAGYVSFHTTDALDKSTVKIGGGQFHTGRFLAMLNMLSSKAGERGESLYLAGEASYTDGPFVRPQDLSRLNLFGKYRVNLSAATRLNVSLSGFRSCWNSSGEIPERAIEQGITGPFGFIDPNQGGSTSRYNAIIKLTSSLSDRTVLENQVYFSRYFFVLHYDDTFFANDSINGDQLRQRETRNLFGYYGKIVHQRYFGNGGHLTSSFGTGWQLNKIYNSELSHTTQENSVLNYLQLGDVTENSFNGHADESYHIDRWLFNAGLRLDFLYFDYRDKLNHRQPAKSKWIASPKLNIEYSFNPTIQLYLKTGKGFHSNDAKVVIANRGKEILPAAYGVDLGLNWKPLPHLYINTGLWYLYLEQEFVYNADDGTTNPGSKTSREGIDLSARYQFTTWLYANIDLNLSRARNREALKGNNYLPLTVPFSSTGGLDLKFTNGIGGAISYRYMKDRPANSDNSLVAKGYLVSDLTATYTRNKYQLGMEVQNLLNTKWREAQFEVTSQLRNERQPVDEISFTPGTPFFLKLKLAVFF